jgi:uncharacterized BrkB/YihY/UPF0761 family membrane protein
MDHDATDRDPTQLDDANLTDVGAPLSRFDQWRERAMDTLADATERIPIIGSIVAAGQRERATGGGLLAGGVAYRVFFWIVPLGLAAGTAVSLLGVTTPSSLEDAARSRGIAGVVASAELQAMTENQSARWYLLMLGVGLTIWFGIGVVRSLTIVYALAWEEKIPKLRRPLFAGAFFTAFTSLMSVAAAALSWVMSTIGLGTIAYTTSVILVYGAAAFFISMFFPHGDAPPRALIPGCLLLSAGGLGLQVFVDVYLAPKLGRSINTYGMLGAATVVLLWLYVMARLITVSAFLNATLWRVHNDRPRDAPAASARRVTREAGP